MHKRIGTRLFMSSGLFMDALIAATPSHAAQPISGRWLTIEGKAIVEIASCGNSLCGRIARIVKPIPGRPHTDTHNPDPKLRDKPLEGLAILNSFSDAGAHWKGTIYDPESGKSYTARSAAMATER